MINLPHGDMRFPIFLPDATRGVVRSIDSADLEACGVEALVMNTFHLMQHPGSTTIKALGGLHKMTGWQRPIVTDSGGFQIYSLIRQNPKNGFLNDKGATFRTENGREYNLTPEKSIQLQMSYGADILVCLDDCTHPDDPMETQRESVKRTVRWAKRCKTEFENLLKNKKKSFAEQRPLLFAVVQGGSSFELRKECAEALLEIGFDGYGYGGWPLDSDGNLVRDIFSYTREQIPMEFPMHALGVGHPPNIVECSRLGYPIFDSAMPTRDARNGRLSIWADPDAPMTGQKDDWFKYVYINDDKHIKTDLPISPHCDCLCCQRYSIGYLHHLFEINDTLAFRLATMHNLRFMSQLMERLRHESR